MDCERLFKIQLLEFGLNHHLAVGRALIEAVVALMIILGDVEHLCGADLGYDRIFKEFLRFGFRVLRTLVLGFAMVENGRAVLCARVGALTI